MKPIEFPSVNVVFGEAQPEYLPLPAHLDTKDPMLQEFRDAAGADLFDLISESGARGALYAWRLYGRDTGCPTYAMQRAIHVYSAIDDSILAPGELFHERIPPEGAREAIATWEHFSTHGRDQIYAMACALLAFCFWKQGR